MKTKYIIIQIIHIYQITPPTDSITHRITESILPTHFDHPSQPICIFPPNTFSTFLPTLSTFPPMVQGDFCLFCCTRRRDEKHCSWKNSWKKTIKKHLKKKQGIRRNCKKQQNVIKTKAITVSASMLEPNINTNKKVLLRERKRHTARRVAIAISCYCRGVEGGRGSLDKNFSSQSEHVSSQIWCQNFFPLLGGGGSLDKIFFPVRTCIKPNLVSNFFPLLGEGGPST